MLVLKCRILMVEICRLFEKSKNEENTTCILGNQLYRFSHRTSFVYDECHRRECTSKRFLWLGSCSSVNWNLSVGRAVRFNSKQPLGMHSFMWWRECTSKRFFFPWSCSFVNWNLSFGRAVRLSLKQPLGIHYFLWWLILYEGIRCENL